MKEILQQFSNVCPLLKWDRFTHVEFPMNAITAFGWIWREDGKQDFLVLNFTEGDEIENIWFCTSSAKYTLEFARITGGFHVDCQRITDFD